MNSNIAELFNSATSRDSYTMEDFNQVDLDNVASVRDEKNQTLLHVAAGYGKTNLVSYLISQGADVNAQDLEGQAPLHNAACHGHYTISCKLIKAGALVDLRDSRGWSPLHFALARKDNVERISPLYWTVIELLLESGADPYLKTCRGRSCLSRITNDEDRRAVKIAHLLNRLRDCPEDNTEVRDAIVDKYLREKDFFELVKIGDENLNVLKLLTTPRLLNSRLRDCDDITPLHRAAGYNHTETAQLFISQGARVEATDSFGRIPLHNAAQYGHVEMIELLVAARSDINKQDLIGYSPLHVAASNQTYTACLKLIELGANIEAECREGQLPFDLASTEDVKEVLDPKKLRHNLEVVPSSSDQAIYIDIKTTTEELYQKPAHSRSLPDNLMLDSSSSQRLFANTSHTIKKIILDTKDPRYEEVKNRMFNTIMLHSTECHYTDYDILSIELILHEKVWSKYKLMCQRLEIDYGTGSKNERLLFHGSNFINKIQTQGFDERFAQRNGMFGAGLYFAEHSSKSNQYTFGFGQGCQVHQDKSCYICERKMVYAQVALGRSLMSREAIPDCAHAPPGFSSVTGSPESTKDLKYPEYVIYNGDQAYPLFVVRYRIKK